ncbi:hypothetical protein D3C72_2110900 [compost metagenome]
MGARVNALGQQPAGLVAALAGLAQTHLGVSAKGQHLFLAADPVLQAPPLAAARRHPQQQAVRVVQLERLVAGFGVFDGGVGERHGGKFLGV